MSDALTGTAKLEIERREAVVTFTLTCTDEYDAMLIYDKSCSELAKGSIKITLSKHDLR